MDQAPPILTIGLPTVVGREKLFSELHDEVKRQAEGKPVEIIVALDNKEISIGKKRQNILEQAAGDYIVYIDDDDWIAVDYVDQLLAATEQKPDCIGFKIECTRNGRRPTIASASIRWGDWADGVGGFSHVRTPYQKTPIKRALALCAGFPDMRYGEDRVYSNRVYPLLKTEVYLDKILYYYRFSTHENSNFKYGFSREETRTERRHKWGWRGARI